MNKPNFEEDLANHINQLSPEKQPQRDLWAGIELAISQESEAQANTLLTSAKKYYLVAATVAMFGVLGWMSVGQQATVLNGDDLVASLTEQHQLQKQALLVRFEDQPALTKNWQGQLEELDEAADAIKKALSNEPNNMALLKMLQNVHQQQINLIERVHSPKWSQI
ncbi:hypothetical protein [Paraglaciecola aestuariivivens]